MIPDSKVHGANVGPTWGRQDPGGPHVGHMNFVIWDDVKQSGAGTKWPPFYRQYNQMHFLEWKLLYWI